MDKFSPLERSLNYKFKDINLLKCALTHRSYSRNNNERLEFVGDGILDYAIAIILYNRYPELAEGVLSKIRASVVNQESLNDLACEINLGQFIFIGDGEEKSGGRQRSSILADCVEAIYAAISIDSNVNESVKVIEQMFNHKLQNATELLTKDGKSLLQEYVQAKQMGTPVYNVIETRGPDHDSIFKVECVVNSLNIRVTAEGKSKKEASQVAANKVLEIINERFTKNAKPKK